MSVRACVLVLVVAVFCLVACSDPAESDPGAAADAGQDTDGADSTPDAVADAPADAPDEPDAADAPDVEPDAREGIPVVTEWTGACTAEREVRMVDLDGVKLHTTCAGEGETLLFLHGFPEWWYGWNDLLPHLPGYRTVAPDMRGYNLSDKPAAEADYTIEVVSEEVGKLIDALGGKVVLVGHDWGGIIAWAVAARYPEKLRGLVILNAPHPNVFLRYFDASPEQRRASSYFNFFIAEGAEVSLVSNDFTILAGGFTGILSAEDLALYKEAWGRENAMDSMLNYYRANLDDDGRPDFQGEYPIAVPTLVLWGLGDTALLAGNLEGLDEFVPTLTVETFPDATHWIAHEEPEAVAASIDGFVGGLPD